MTLFTMKDQTRQLLNHLHQQIEQQNLEIISYAELSAVAGADVRRDPRARHYLDSACKICERETGRLIACVPGLGIKVLAPQEQLKLANGLLGKQRRAAHRGIKRLGRVEYDQLTPAQRIAVQTKAIFLGTVMYFARPSRLQKIEQAAAQADRQLSVAETLKLFAPGA